ncbi:evasin-1-like [Dermacentor andersoni]|uniref:evasin-1-like n=1 Tax=Dermacentor andersoni TaxID=34620 RepID=UPI00215520D3|nr:evasin-1-like [Dermacentor andersoni]
MKTFIYAAAIGFAVLVAGEQDGGVSSDDDVDYNSGCPFFVAENFTGFVTVVSCSHQCNNATETLDDDTRCFDIGDDVLYRMTPNIAYSCPLGKCKNGTCVRNGKHETCYRRNMREELE